MLGSSRIGDSGRASRPPPAAPHWVLRGAALAPSVGSCRTPQVIPTQQARGCELWHRRDDASSMVRCRPSTCTTLPRPVSHDAPQRPVAPGRTTALGGAAKPPRLLLLLRLLRLVPPPGGCHHHIPPSTASASACSSCSAAVADQRALDGMGGIVPSCLTAASDHSELRTAWVGPGSLP